MIQNYNLVVQKVTPAGFSLEYVKNMWGLNAVKISVSLFICFSGSLESLNISTSVCRRSSCPGLCRLEGWPRRRTAAPRAAAPGRNQSATSSGVSWNLGCHFELSVRQVVVSVLQQRAAAGGGGWRSGRSQQTPWCCRFVSVILSWWLWSCETWMYFTNGNLLLVCLNWRMEFSKFLMSSTFTNQSQLHLSTLFQWSIIQHLTSFNVWKLKEKININKLW